MTPPAGSDRVPAADPPAWLDELRLEPGPPYQTMGTRALDLTEWLTVDARREDELAQKRRLLAERRDLVMAISDDAFDACVEVRDLIAEWLHAGADSTLHPLEAAALLVQDDLAVLQRIDDEWILTAGVVCFPSHWNIAEKRGLPLALVHAPVAHYDRELRDKVDRFHDRLTADRPVWRRNWFIAPTPGLHLPAYGVDMTIPKVVQPDGSPLFIRSERQTLRRLPRTDAILFTIRVQVAPLGVLLHRRDLAARMLAAVRSWDEPKRAYTSTGGLLDPLISWLETVAEH